ncbi:MAG: TetR/AcrR family transcriptional regulator [Myxococcota bacterium]
MSAASPFDGPSARELQRRRTRARLYDAALAEFARVGLDRANVATIAREAGVSRPSFYFHFPTKEHVLLELQWRKEQEVADRVRPCADLPSALRALAEALVDAFQAIGSREVARDMLRIYARRPPELALDDQEFPLMQVLGAHFLAAERRGELREGIGPERATTLCLSSVFGYLLSTALPFAEVREDLRCLVGLYLR